MLMKCGKVLQGLYSSVTLKVTLSNIINSGMLGVYRFSLGT